MLFGILDGANGFLFHFLQAFWFRLVVDARLSELRGKAGPATATDAATASETSSGESALASPRPAP